jgi:hypothetical protein
MSHAKTRQDSNTVIVLSGGRKTGSYHCFYKKFSEQMKSSLVDTSDVIARSPE